MKIVFDGDVFLWQKAGGISRFYREIFRRLPELCPDMDMTIVFAGKPVSETSEFRQNIRMFPNLSKNLKPWRFWHHVTPIINKKIADMRWRKMNPDVFCSTYYTTPPVKAPSICVVYDMIFERFPEMFNDAGASMVKRNKIKAVKKAKKIICISESTKKDLVRLLSVSEGKCRVIHLAGFSKVQTRVVSAQNGADKFLLYVGDFGTAYKNFVFLLKSLASCQRDWADNIKLVVVASREPEESERKNFEDILPSNRLRFVTNCGDDELVRFYQQCSAYVCPSLYEGFGIPVLEALSCGAPVVVSDRSSLPEVGGDVAYYFDPTSQKAFHNALERALSDGRKPEHVQKRIEHSRKFSWDKTAREFLEVIREVAG